MNVQVVYQDTPYVASRLRRMDKTTLGYDCLLFAVLGMGSITPK